MKNKLLGLFVKLKYILTMSNNYIKDYQIILRSL